MAALSSMLVLAGAWACTGSHRTAESQPTPATAEPRPMHEAVAGAEAREADKDAKGNASAPAVAAPSSSRLRALGSACERVRAQTHCASLTDAGVALIGIDTGEYCVTPIDGMPVIDSPSGMPIAISWRGSTLHMCLYGARRPELMQIQLDTRTVAHSMRVCASVVDWEGGLLISESSDAELYPDFAAALRAEPSGHLETHLVASASHEGSLYGLIDSGPQDHRRLYEATSDGTVEREIPLMDSQPLLSEDRIVTGLDLTDDGRLVLVVEGRGAGIEVYDASTQRRTTFYASDLSESDWVMRFLACDG